MQKNRLRGAYFSINYLICITKLPERVEFQGLQGVECEAYLAYVSNSTTEA